MISANWLEKTFLEQENDDEKRKRFSARSYLQSIETHQHVYTQSHLYCSSGSVKEKKKINQFITNHLHVVGQ